MLHDRKGQRVIMAGLLIFLALGLKYGQVGRGISEATMLLATLVAGLPIGLNALRALRYRILGIEALVTLAVVGAIFIQEYWEAAVVTFLFMFGSYLESRALEKTRSAIRALLALAPAVARVIRNGEEIALKPEEVRAGDLVVVRAGEKIPVDGIVREGNAYINQAAITGESMPVHKGKELGVYSGTVLESGYLKIEAEKVGKDTLFSRIMQMVEEAQDKKAKTQKFLETFAKYYTPGIVVLATIVFALTRDFPLSLTLLVIACPGALVISTPVSLVAGIGNGAQHGILIKGGEVIEKIGTVKVVAFDKTGTLTEGKPRVTRIQPFSLNKEELLRITASAEKYSEHPLAKAILTAAATWGKKLDLVEPEDSVIIPGQGLKVKLAARPVFVGNRKLLYRQGLEIPSHIDEYIKSEEAKGQTTVLVSDDKQVLGVISLADTLRPEAPALIKRLRAVGVKRVVMLTGDNQRAAGAIAKKLGLDAYFAELLPEDKVDRLKKIQTEFGTTAMVGDGVNDAPALASADLGIAMGGVGTEVAMETADLVLMSDKIKKLAYALGLSRATVRNMKQNIYFSVIVVAILLAGVLAKLVFLSSGMLLHVLSVLAVIINALRLLNYQEKAA